MRRQPDPPSFLALRERMRELLRDVEGWLSPSEAAVLCREAQRAGERQREPRVVEIGTWKGRSTIALATGLAGRGRVFAVDPHLVVPTIPHMSTDRVPELRANLDAAGVADRVELVRERSHDARARFENESIDLLFIDGNHKYEFVLQDIVDWTPTLRPGAVVGFNDFNLQGVRRALLERVAVPRSAFRDPRWRGLTLFFDYRPGESWRRADRVNLVRTKLFLRQEAGFGDPGATEQRGSRVVTRGFRRFVRRVARRLLPVASPPSR